MNIFLGIMIPFAGTALGAACVFLLKNDIRAGVQKALLGFASGIMVAASVWSLLIPAMEMSESMGKLRFIPAALGFMVGILTLLLMDSYVPHQHLGQEEAEGIKKNWSRSMKMVMAVTIHNIPEGMAVGVVFAGIAAEHTDITLAGAFALSVGIAIQNFPEGAIVSMPLRSEENMNKGKAFLYGAGSGIVEPMSEQALTQTIFLEMKMLERRVDTDTSLSACICGRCHDLRSCGGTDTGDKRRRTQQYRNNRIRAGIYDYDGA